MKKINQNNSTNNIFLPDGKVLIENKIILWFENNKLQAEYDKTKINEFEALK